MTTQEKQRKVLLAGATGLVGGLILQALLADRSVTEVHALGRRPLAVRHPKLQSHQVDFSRLPLLPATDEVYLALGTTIDQANRPRRRCRGPASRERCPPTIPQACGQALANAARIRPQTRACLPSF